MPDQQATGHTDLGDPEGSDTTTTGETRTANATEAEAPASSAYLHFRGPNNVKSPLLGYQPFIMYWNPRNSNDFYPVGLWENTDLSPKSQVSKSEVLVFRFKTKSGERLTAADLSPPGGLPEKPAIPFELDWYTCTSWERPCQRKGQNYYIAAGTSNMPMRGVRTCNVYADGIRFALRMDIAGKGDAWISDEDNTGSIRMQNPTERRAYLVAVRYGTNDPFGSQTTFRKRTWNDLIG